MALSLLPPGEEAQQRSRQREREGVDRHGRQLAPPVVHMRCKAAVVAAAAAAEDVTGLVVGKEVQTADVVVAVDDMVQQQRRHNPVGMHYHYLCHCYWWQRSSTVEMAHPRKHYSPMEGGVMTAGERRTRHRSHCLRCCHGCRMMVVAVVVDDVAVARVNVGWLLLP